MDRATLEQLLREAESLLQRGEQNIAHQREVIGTLERGGHDATAAKMFFKAIGKRAGAAHRRSESIVQGTGRLPLVVTTANISRRAHSSRNNCERGSDCHSERPAGVLMPRACKDRRWRQAF